MTLGRDGIAGLVCLAISIWLLVLTLSLPPAIMVPIGPAFYPRVVLGLMALFSAILIVNDVLAARRRRAVIAEVPPAARARAAVAAPTAEAAVAVSSAGAAPAGHKPNYSLVLATFVLFGIYVLILPYLGFRISTFLFVCVLQPTLEWPGTWQRWLLVAAIALATTFLCVLAFEDYLLVLLPRGSLTGM